MVMGVLLLGGAMAASAAPAVSAFNPDSLVVYRVGAVGGSLTASASAAVFLDEYSTSGTLLQSIALPTSTSGSNKALTASSTATSEGLLTRSADGRYLVATGYNAAVGTASIAGTASSSTARTIALIDKNGVVDSSTALTDFSTGNNPRSAVSTNGTDIWMAGGAGGVRYTTKGSTTSTQLSTSLTNNRQVNLFDGQLYASDSSGTSLRLTTVGSVAPKTSGQTMTNLPGFSTNTGSPYAFYFADLSASVAGNDTLYVADDAAGLQKWSLVSGAWTLTNTVGTGSDAYRGLTARVSGSTVSLFATRKGGSAVAGGGELVSLVDTGGYNANFSSSTFTTLATASANTSFRGVAPAPVPVPAALPLLLSALGLVGAARRRSRG
jgi:hypothetical protein